MSCTSLIITNHSNDVKVLAWIHLIVCLCLSCLVNDTLAKVREGLPRYCVRYRAVTLRLLETNCIIHSGKVASARTNLKLLKVERLYLTNE